MIQSSRKNRSKCRTFKISCSWGKHGTRETWNKAIRNDMKEREVSKELAEDWNTWMPLIRNHASRANIKNKH